MKQRLLISIAACLVSSCVSVSSSAQDRNASQFPSDLKPALDTRLNLFLGAQSDGRWDYVAALLGDTRYGYFGPSVRYTKSHKTCLISEMQNFSIIHFDYTIQESPHSSEILSTPASRRWWRLVGEGTFQTGTKEIKQKTWLTAYRDHGEWFFSPPNIDDAAGSQLSREELLRDRKDQVDLPTKPDSPLEVIDLHVFVDPKDVKLRDIHFRLRNKTNKPVTRYGYKISDKREEGSITFGTGAEKHAIAPNGTSPEFHENYVLSVYRCEGEARVRIEIGDVGFADGTEWSAPESTATEKADE